MKQKNIIEVLQSAGWNILVLFHHSEPQNKRIFIVNDFTYPQNSVHILDLRAKEITDQLTDSSFYTQFPVEKQPGLNGNEYQRQRIDTLLSDIELKHYQFSPDYSWEWYLAS